MVYLWVSIEAKLKISYNSFTHFFHSLVAIFWRLSNFLLHNSVANNFFLINSFLRDKEKRKRIFWLEEQCVAAQYIKPQYMHQWPMCAILFWWVWTRSQNPSQQVLKYFPTNWPQLARDSVHLYSTFSTFLSFSWEDGAIWLVLPNGQVSRSNMSHCT